LTINKILADFAIGQIVHMNIDPSVHSGLPHSRYQGLTGIVVAKQGKVFCVRLNNGNQSLDLFVHPAHLKAVESMIVEKAF
jgi:large subunit ribosomal protein L21e